MLSYAEEVPQRHLAPPSDWDAAGGASHCVQFYESDGFLIESLSDFVATGLGAGDVCVVVATDAHRSGVAQRLQANGFDLEAASDAGRYIALDATETLSSLMHDGMPDPARFGKHIGGLIGSACTKGGHVRVFGEMVALLWADGEHQAAIRLEGLWNDLRETHDFTLVCAYPLVDFDADGQAPTLHDVVGTHSHVIPAESYSRLPTTDERLRAIAHLQQKARALDVQIDERRRATAQFRFLADSMPQKVFTTTAGGSFEHVNRRWLEFTGLTLEEAQQGGWTRVVHPDDALETAHLWRLAVAGRTRFEAEHRFRASDGSYRWHLSRAHPMRDADGTVLMWIGSSTDIEDQKQREADLDRSIRLRDEFLATISHDLKTPLTVLQGQAQVLLRRMARGSVDEQTMLTSLRRIEDRARMMSSLVDELLDISQLRAGHELQLYLRPVDLAALVREAVAGAQELTETHQLVLHAEPVELIGRWDQIRLRRVIANLLNNAVKYSPAGGKVHIDLSLEPGSRGTEAVLAVRDHGTGIAAGDLEHIFEWFYRGGNARGKIVGSGLGLAGSKQIVEQLGGTIAVESKPGKGSTFTVRLPVA